MVANYIGRIRHWLDYSWGALMILEIISSMIVSASLWISVVVAHEFGHYFALKRLKVPVRIIYTLKKLSTQWDACLFYDDRKLVYESGIWFGGICIAAAALVNPVYLFYVFPYVIGCKEDIKQVMKYGKR